MMKSKFIQKLVNIITKVNKTYDKIKISKSPQLNLVWGFFLYTVIGFLLLSIPLLHKTDIHFVDNLFIATSAISTTGLVTIGVFESYTWLGQFIILSLFQIGGIGYMTLTTYFLLYTTKKITQWHNQLIETEFVMPNTIDIKDFIQSVIVFTLVMEILGALGFYFAFRDLEMGFLSTCWFSIFHSISAFCTAGFSLFSNGFENYQSNTYINILISILAISGSLGFIVITDLWNRLKGKSNQLSFTTKIVVFGFVGLLSIGTALIYFNSASQTNFNEARFLTSFFQSMSAMTTVGFNTTPFANFSLPIILGITFLMYIGASPSGTAGGMKITTLTAMLAILKSRVFGQKKITFMGRLIPFERLFVATSTFMLYTSLIFAFTFLLSLSESFSLEEILFEVASSLGTVGLSLGITGELSSIGKLLIVCLMFIGRVGVLTFGFALLEKQSEQQEKIIKDDLAV